MQLDAQFWTALLQIIGINIVLSGDNAVVIAMACRSLPPERRRLGIALGAGGAIVLRIVFTIFIVTLMSIDYLKVVGGVLLLWIGYSLMVSQDKEGDVAAGATLWHAVRIVLVADAVMSLDNVVAVAAAANGSYVLLILGLVLSVPLVIYGATLLVTLLNRFPLIVPGGAALIGYVAGEVIITDPALRDWVEHHMPWLHWAAPLIGALLVVLVGRIVNPSRSRPALAEATAGIVGSAAVIGLRAALQASGRLLVAVAPRLVAFVASALGYAVSQDTSKDPIMDVAIDVMQAARPVFVAILAVGVGEIVAWLTRKARPAAAER
jgi:YjbE family integral membrane protein